VERQHWAALTHRQLAHDPGVADTGILHVPARRGKGKRLLELPAASVGSSVASPRQRRRRAVVVETAVAAVSSHAAAADPAATDDQQAQLAALMARRPVLFTAAAAAAGIRIAQRRLTVAEMVQLTAVTGLPYTEVRTIRSFLQSCGIDVLQSEHKVRAAVAPLFADDEFHVGAVERTVDDEPQRIDFVRVSDLWRTVTR